MTTMVKELDLAKIRIDGGTQPRVAIDQDAVDEHKSGYELGEHRPPLDVFFDGADYWLADGFHRWHGAQKAHLEKHSCTIHSGTQRDAVLFSVGANAKHGLKRTNADKRKAVLILLNDPEWSQKSQRWIAEKCGVSHNLVGEISAESEDDRNSGGIKCHLGNRSAGKDGKSYPSARGKRKPQKAKAAKKESPKPPETSKPRGGTTFDPSEFDPDIEPEDREVSQDDPKHLVGVLDGLKQYKSLQREVSLIYGKVEALAKLPIGSFIQLQEIELHINQVKADLKAYSFGDNCPTCQNKPSKSCQRCKGRGWIAHAQMGQLSDLDKNWLKSNSVKP